MTALHELENREIIASADAPFIYYIVTVFPDGAPIGYTLENAYNTTAGARNAAIAALMKLNVKGEAIVRKETVYKRIPGKLEISTSGVFQRVIDCK